MTVLKENYDYFLFRQTLCEINFSVKKKMLIILL